MLQSHGPLAVKFAQWASTRPDILPPSVCANFAKLQDAVAPHDIASTSAALDSAFGPQWSDCLELDEPPIGSGCMAQVYRGRLRVGGEDGEDALEREVAVKVRHPGARELVDLDLAVMWQLASALNTVWPGSRYLGIMEAIGHFEAFVRPQADLRIEAANLEAFRSNFPWGERSKGIKVHFPEVIRPFVADAVLVESYERGVPLQKVLGQGVAVGAPAPNPIPGLPADVSLDNLRERVGKLCMDAFLQMLFKDNFIHGDLHPGNIHVRFPLPLEANAQGERKDTIPEPELVLFDAGLAISLSRQDRRNFMDVFHSIATCNGRRAGELMVERTPGDRDGIIDPDTFVTSVGSLIEDVASGGLSLGQVRLGEAFSSMITLACQHQVKLETSFVTVATSIILIEGVGRQLNPIVDLVWAAMPLLTTALSDSLVNGCVSA